MVDKYYFEEIQERITRYKSIGIDINKKFSLINDIIQLKILSNDQKLIYSTYSDFKEYIKLYITLLDEEKFDYDIANLPHIIQQINNLPPNQRIELLKYLRKQLNRIQIPYSKNILMTEIRRNEILHLKSNLNVRHWFLLIVKYSSLNIKALLFSLLVVIVVEGLFLLPSWIDGLTLFKIQYDSYSSVFIVNHYLNILGSLIDITDNFKIIPINELGFATLFLGKLFFILVILNFIVREIRKWLEIE